KVAQVAASVGQLFTPSPIGAVQFSDAQTQSGVKVRPWQEDALRKMVTENPRNPLDQRNKDGFPIMPAIPGSAAQIRAAQKRWIFEQIGEEKHAAILKAPEVVAIRNDVLD